MGTTELLNQPSMTTARVLLVLVPRRKPFFEIRIVWAVPIGPYRTVRLLSWCVLADLASVEIEEEDSILGTCARDARRVLAALVLLTLLLMLRAMLIIAFPRAHHDVSWHHVADEHVGLYEQYFPVEKLRPDAHAHVVAQTWPVVRLVQHLPHCLAAQVLDEDHADWPSGENNR